MIKYYIQVFKPGIILGNLFSIISGFFLAKNLQSNYWNLLYVLIGTALVIASGCAINNCIDVDIDSKMIRTKNRALVKKILKINHVILYALALMSLGLIILYFMVNTLSCFLAAIGHILYTMIYSFIKRKSIYSTIIGSLSGSLPVVIGYCAAVNYIDLCAVIVFLSFIFWQISHFYSINIFYIKDYTNASIPTFPVIKGINVTRDYIVISIIAYIFSISLLSINEYMSYKCTFFLNIVNIIWLHTIFNSYYKKEEKKCLNWAKKSFFMSIISVLFFNLMVLIDHFYFN